MSDQNMKTRHPAELLFSDQHPLTASFNMEFEDVVDHVLSVKVTAPESFADADGEHAHSGFITLLLDTVMGSCVIGEMDTYQPIATIKLTCNHLEKVKTGRAVTCKATFDGIRKSVAYVRGEVFSGPDNMLVAQAIGTFMVGTRSRPLETGHGT